MTPWPPGRTLAVDFGDRRTGVAVCDALGITVTPLARLAIADPADLARAVARLAHEEEVERLVVGWPLNMDGSEGERTAVTRAFVTLLETAAPRLPVELWDERLTSVEANDLLRERGVRGRARQERVDSAAAAILLRAWLEGQRAEHARDDDATD